MMLLPDGATVAGALPSAWRTSGTRQSPGNGRPTWRFCRVLDHGTRQSLICLPSARSLALGKEAFLLTLWRPLCRVFWLMHSAKWPIFFVSLFSIFGYKYNWNISKYMDITGSYYNKYIIDKYDNNTNTSNTSPSHISQVRYITQVHHIERVWYV